MPDEKLEQKLGMLGYNRDVEVEKDTWLNAKAWSEVSGSMLGLSTILRTNEPIFRDEKEMKSIELKDYRNRSDFENSFVAKLEHFNPEVHPILHVLVDVPTWVVRNRIMNRGPKESD